jgi:hypothetical protein
MCRLGGGWRLLGREVGREDEEGRWMLWCAGKKQEQHGWTSIAEMLEEKNKNSVADKNAYQLS